jgi:hypothetical protein
VSKNFIKETACNNLSKYERQSETRRNETKWDGMRRNETKLRTHMSDVIIASLHHNIVNMVWLFTMSHNPLIMWSCWTRMVTGLSSKAATLHENQICIICSIENVLNFIFVQNNVLSLKIDIIDMRIWSRNPAIRDEDAKRLREEETKRRWNYTHFWDLESDFDKTL